MSTHIQVAEKEKIKLAKISTKAPDKVSEAETRALTSAAIVHADKLQFKLYAENKQKLLIIFQGMDGSGKDSTTRHVIGPLNPQGVQVSAFKVPEPSESARDFLWRYHLHVPPAGQIGVFNRSYYEEVLIVRVAGLKAEKEWQKHYEHINAFEKLLTDTGTRILKFYLHLSKEKQKEKLEERMSKPEKKWKYDANDWNIREQWNEYMNAYEDVFERCSSKQAPWHIIPADDKWYRDFCVAGVISKTLEEMNPEFPQ